MKMKSGIGHTGKVTHLVGEIHIAVPRRALNCFVELFQIIFSDANIGLATARAGNVIGGGDWAEDG